MTNLLDSEYDDEEIEGSGMFQAAATANDTVLIYYLGECIGIIRPVGND